MDSVIFHDCRNFVNSCNLTNKANLHTSKVEIHARQKLRHFNCYVAKAKLSCRVFIRHQRSENSPPTTQNSPAKFWWPGAQLYFFYSDVEPLCSRKLYLAKTKIYTERVEQTILPSFCVRRWKLLYYWNRLVTDIAQKCAILTSYRRDSTCLNKQWLNI